MLIYYRNLETTKLGVTEVVLADNETYQDAVLKVKEDLVGAGIGFEEPVLALFHGGKE